MATVTTVGVSLANSADITQTTAGGQELTDFAARNAANLDPAATESLTKLRGKFQVLKIDVAKVLATLGRTTPCGSPGEKLIGETLIAPRSVSNIIYKVNPEQALEPDYNPNLGLDACKLNVEWDEAAPGDSTQDDEVNPAATRPYAQMIAADCFARKWHWEDVLGTHTATSWNDACYQNWVERYDGNSSWNYYTKKAMSSCKAYKGRLISCGHGVERASTGPTVYWIDWAPTATQDRNDCRTRAIGVSLFNVSVGGDFDLCERQVINKYSEAGKMSSYWKGKVTSTRSTAHQVAVKVTQSSPRPKWHHWINSDTCIGCLA
ncbi:hypothetical protein [Streptomyces sp. 2R]|uniref:hypothetical protein n=1 Tax=Streptomyces sp. 2R TaxID=1883452 RepID=UPI00117F3BF6|nr:hypothetical protein [Streptomyces sp. 2R]